MQDREARRSVIEFFRRWTFRVHTDFYRIVRPSGVQNVSAVTMNAGGLILKTYRCVWRRISSFFFWMMNTWFQLKKRAEDKNIKNIFLSFSISATTFLSHLIFYIYDFFFAHPLRALNVLDMKIKSVVLCRKTLNPTAQGTIYYS